MAKPKVDDEVDCVDADVMVAMRDEFGISFGKVGKLVTAGDAYDILAAKLKTKLPADAWPRLKKLLATATGRAITSKTSKLR